MNQGVNDTRRIECKKSKEHGHYPADEECPYCEKVHKTSELQTSFDGMNFEGFYTYDPTNGLWG